MFRDKRVHRPIISKARRLLALGLSLLLVLACGGWALSYYTRCDFVIPFVGDTEWRFRSTQGTLQLLDFTPWDPRQADTIVALRWWQVVAAIAVGLLGSLYGAVLIGGIRPRPEPQK